MYKSPITIYEQMAIDNEIYKAVRKVYIDVDKKELLKALQYDRGQYDEGYVDGYHQGKQDTARAIIRELECAPIGMIDGTIMNLYKKYGVAENGKKEDSTN